jgi:uncharacterized SAM-binding protein YcdF (DUF218 family)
MLDAPRSAFLIGLLAGLYVVGLVWFAEAIPRDPPDRTETTDAIVVLTGGRLRLREGFALLTEGRAAKMLISGVNRGIELPELLRVAGTAPLSVACCVELGYAADNTAGNADETRAWMAKEGFTSLRLVTSSYHMPRSLVELARVMPEVTLVPYPVVSRNFRTERWWMHAGTARLILTEYLKFLPSAARLGMARLLSPWEVSAVAGTSRKVLAGS